jgi:anti-anti-sigma factor
MRCDQVVLDGAMVLTLQDARIDLDNADAFKAALLAAVPQASRALILDFTAVDYISSAGLRSLMIAQKSAKAANCTLAVAALKPLTREIFAISRFDVVFVLFDTVRGAIEHLAPQALAGFDAL